jgi:hypothetical protein
MAVFVAGFVAGFLIGFAAAFAVESGKIACLKDAIYWLTCKSRGEGE